MSDPDRPLAGRHALVTGGGRGIGLAVARRLAGDGASVTVTGRDRAALRDAVAELPRAQAQPCDVTDPAAVDRAFDAAEAAFGPVDILVNNAGQAVAGPFVKSSPADLRAMLAVNLEGVWLATQGVLAGMLGRGFGRVITIASTAGLIGYPYVAAYVAAKHGAVGLTRALALEVAGKGVTVNAVCPGYTDTDLVAEAVANITAKTGRSAGEARAELARRNPQGRLIAPEEVADCVAWLAGPAAGSVNGQAIAVDGGETAS